MKKISDFAREKGVTVQAVYKHLRNNKHFLEGHYEKRGKNGTWLDDDACEFIAQHMITNPVVVVENSQKDEIERLRAKNEELNEKLIKTLEQLSEAQKELKLASKDQERVKLLEDNKKALEAKYEALETNNVELYQEKENIEIKYTKLEADFEKMMNRKLIDRIFNKK